MTIRLLCLATLTALACATCQTPGSADTQSAAGSAVSSPEQAMIGANL
jgi:hypothetical protein